MFDMVRATAENVPGDNLVTTLLEHPSSIRPHAGEPRRFVARLGGEEFLLAWTGLSIEDALACSNELRERLRDTSFTDMSGACP